MDIILLAINFATKAHSGQKRKGKDVSYITHPLSVGLLLASSGVKQDVVVAGILHDTIEDTNTSYNAIQKQFGKEVADIVNDVTEQDRNLSWIERKKQALEHVKDMQNESVLVKTADVLQNISEQIEDFKVEGNKMFERFNAKKEQQLNRYIKLTEAIKNREIDNPLLPQLEKKVLELQVLWE
jgi:(p)ppGpp synthase/HD superfamily hydrolase